MLGALLPQHAQSRRLDATSADRDMRLVRVCESGQATGTGLATGSPSRRVLKRQAPPVRQVHPLPGVELDVPSAAIGRTVLPPGARGGEGEAG